MKLGYFREKTADLPDDTEVVIWEDGEVSWFEMKSGEVIPATPIHTSPVLVLNLGQQVELEFDLAVRTGIDE